MARRILIVDDEPNIVISLEFLMRREGYDVSVAADGTRALQLLALDRPDVVLLDVMLPKLDGFAVCERIRTDPRWAAVKILILTAKGREAEIAKGLRLGADAYVTKPFSTQELVARVRELIAQA